MPKTVKHVFNIYFDGGTASGGNGYGSWEVSFYGFRKRASRVAFLKHVVGIPSNSVGQPFRSVTNNIAEYLSLIGALEWIQNVKNKIDYHVVIHGDSKLVLHQVDGNYRVKAAHLLPFRDRCRTLLSGFGGWSCEWQPRKHSVSRFGH